MLIKQQRVQNGMEPILQWGNPIPFCPEAALCTPQPLLPFYSTHHGDGLTSVLLAGHRIGWVTHTRLLSKLKRPLELELPSWLPSGSSHPCSREHSWAKGLQAQRMAGGSLIPTSKLGMLERPWAEPWLSSAPECSQALWSLGNCPFLYSQRAEPAEGQTRMRPLGAAHQGWIKLIMWFFTKWKTGWMHSLAKVN